MLKRARHILATMDPKKRMRAQAMMKAHQKGKGECHIIDGVAVLRWPATNRKGEGDGYWTSVISGGIASCACPSFQHDNGAPCKHLILLARLAIYHVDRDAQQAEVEATAQVCTG